MEIHSESVNLLPIKQQIKILKTMTIKMWLSWKQHFYYNIEAVANV